MDRRFALRWAADLRHTKAPQIREAMHDGEGYDALGRAVRVWGRQFVDRGVDKGPYSRFAVERKPEDNGTDPFYLMRQQTGLYSAQGSRRDGKCIIIGDRTYSDLMQANDSKCTFQQIADYIEENYEHL